MITRQQLIETIKRTLAGGTPSDDFDILDEEVNILISEGIATAAKKSMIDGMNMEDVKVISDGFYTTVKGIDVTEDADTKDYKIQLPSIPVGTAYGDGVATLSFIMDNGLSKNAIKVSLNELAYFEGLPTLKNKVYYWTEGSIIWAKSKMDISKYKASLRMVRTMDTSLGSTLNVPPDYIPIIRDYCLQVLMKNIQIPKDEFNDNLKQP